MDAWLEIFKGRLNLFTVEELNEIVENIDLICFDTLNYDEAEKKFCPIAVAMGLHKILDNPTDEIVSEHIALVFRPPNALKGVEGTFYTDNRREDLLKLCLELIKEKSK